MSVKLDKMLTELGWTKAELARRIDVHPNTITNWSGDRAEPPTVVYKYLGLLIWARKLEKQIHEALK